MDINLSADEVDFAIYMYLAIKGYDSTNRNYVSNPKMGLKYVECRNVTVINPNIEKIIEKIQRR